MKLTIVAATGGIGRILVERAVSAGHEVTAVARRPIGFPQGVRSVTADLAMIGSDDLRGAVDGADAVLSALGPRKASQAGIASVGTRTLIDAMDLAQTRRLVVVSAAPVRTPAGAGQPVVRDDVVTRVLLNPFARTILRRPFADLELMEQMLRDSDLDWTSVRPPRLTDRPLSTTYRTAYGRGLAHALVASRADVADLMLGSIDDPAAVRQTIAIAR